MPTPIAPARHLFAPMALGGALLIAGARADGPAPLGEPRAREVRAGFIASLDTLEFRTAGLLAAVRAAGTNAPASAALTNAFVEARRAYKHVEFFVEYYAPMAAIQLNGPPIDDVEFETLPMMVVPATGFQVLEGLLFPSFNASNREAALAEAQAIARIPQYLRGLAPGIPMYDANIFDALRLEVARISVLGIVGFDSPVLRTSMREASIALQSIRDALRPYRDDLGVTAPQVVRALDSLVAGAIRTTSTATFDDFDRLAFIVSFANPIARGLADARDALEIGVPPGPRLWRADAPTLFERDAFDVEMLRAPGMPVPAAAAIPLGRRLFNDPVLSGPAARRSCASCHLPERAFTDGLPTSPSLVHGRRLRNAPTLFNAALQRMQFADMRTAYLEEQVTAVVSNEAEMSGGLDMTARILRADSSYRRAFAAAFPQQKDSLVSPATIAAALAAYVRSLDRLESPVDSALRGAPNVLDREERMGFNLFAGKALCATCHFLPLTNGTVPPAFERMEQEVIGVPATAVWRNATIDPDSGRIGVTRSELHRFAFKTPTVRNAAVTAPYMHNGVYRTLDDVIRFYDVGGGRGIGIDLPNQTLPPDSLHLTAAEKRALVRFIQALTDTRSDR